LNQNPDCKCSSTCCPDPWNIKFGIQVLLDLPSAVWINCDKLPGLDTFPLEDPSEVLVLIKLLLVSPSKVEPKSWQTDWNPLWHDCTCCPDFTKIEILVLKVVLVSLSAVRINCDNLQRIRYLLFPKILWNIGIESHVSFTFCSLN